MMFKVRTDAISQDLGLESIKIANNRMAETANIDLIDGTLKLIRKTSLHATQVATNPNGQNSNEALTSQLERVPC